MLNRVKNWSNKHLRSLLALFLIGATVSLTSCFNDDETIPVPPAAYVLVYQGSPDAPEMDIYANQNKINNYPIKYADGVNYGPFYIGERTFKFTSVNSLSSILEKNFTIKEDSVYSIFVLDQLSQIDAILVQDEWEEPVAEEAQLRLVNLSPDAGDVILEISEQESAFVNNLPFGTASDFEGIESGTYDLTVKSSTTGETLVTATDIELKGNRVITLILRGLASSTDNDKKIDLQLITNYVNY
ncbi:DUF4397 domain-containing protein [Algoriphagus lutimaris]|uniref:DUF4397 domain-containing protein n=1 Tax=Algoriphagus lutimaris TaxID=613197 RepID=UPI00196A6083|nr:DUF4397 domain-containing protein [Algoriphagus lutimaris]MBN3518617.1 DUF4397 domain-containing protein [Algoriphagus lutimaris]